MTKGTRRRLAAIVAADVVGYSRLMAQDEEGTLAAVKVVHQELFDPHFDQHGGRLVKTTGDGLLAEFPSVLDAVRCCVGVQEGLAKRAASAPENKRLQFRIGINLGDIIIDGDDIYGDGVNVAARLEALAEPGGICVSDDVMRQIRGKLDLPFADDGDHTLKNIPEPVHVWRWSLGTSTQPPIVDVSEPIPGFDGRPAIAVLAFDNLSKDPEQEFLCDGIAEDILTRLAMRRWLPVIARNSSFTYKGTSVGVKVIGQELGARYVLEGSVRKAGSRVRVTGQLIDTESGHHVWAERYDRDIDDIFAVQDEITDAITASLEPAVGRAEMQRAQRKDPQNLDAWDYHQRGMWYLNKVTEPDLERAYHFFRQSIAADQTFASPHAGICLLGFLLRTLGYEADWAPSREEVVEAGSHATRLDEMDHFAHSGHGFSAMVAGDHDAALASANRSLELNPSFALGYHCLHSATFFLGDFEASIDAVKQAARISPNDPWLFYFLTGVSACHYMLHQYEEAIDAGRIAVERYPMYANALRWYALSLAQAGRQDEAGQMIQRWRDITNSSVEKAHNAYPIRDPVHLEHYRDGLRKAGL
jgi:adenylate cyclase